MTQERKHRTPKHKGKSRSTSKTNIMKGVGSYSRGQRRLKGRGGYAEDIGGALGSWLGQKAGSLFKSITGLGEYNVRQNTLVAKPSDPPIVSNTRSGTRIQHREYIQDVYGSENFVIQSFPINPGLSGTFPWCCSVSNAFEEYKMHGILFEFKSTSATALNSTNTALGTVIMATEYNPLHGPFTAKRDMENYVYSTSSPPSVSALHPIECARDMSVLDNLFVRNVPLLGADLRFSDIGNFQIATVGMQATAQIGELWVTYDIELIKPKLPDAFSSTGPAHYVYSSGAFVLPNPTNGVPVTSNLYGTPAGQKLSLRGTGVTPVALDTNQITFNQTGQYLVHMCITGVTAAVISAATTSLTHCTEVSMFPEGGTGLIGLVQRPYSGANVNAHTYSTCVNVSQVGATLIWFLGTIATTVNSVDLWVIPLPTGFTAPISTEQEKLFAVLDTFSKRLDRLTAITECDDEEDEYHESLSEVKESWNKFHVLDPKPTPSAPRLIRSEPADLSASTSSLASALLERLTTRAA